MSENLTPAQRAAFAARLAEEGMDPDAFLEQDAPIPSPASPIRVESIAELKGLGGVPEESDDATVSYPAPLQERPWPGLSD